jgi:hypothetical protein
MKESHVHLLLPFVDHGEVYEYVMERLREELEAGEKVTVRELESIIRSAILRKADDDILNLTDFPWKYWDYRKHFDLTGCDRCRHSVKVEDDLFCLNRRCWKDRMNIAKQRYEKEMEEKKREREEKGTLLGWNPKKKWIRESCPGCEHLTVERDEDGDEFWWCTNPECAGQKEEEYQEWLKRHRQERTKAMDKAFNKYIKNFKGVTAEELRIAVLTLSRASFSQALKKALRPWMESTKNLKWGWWQDVVRNIPDDDLPLAFVRILYYDNMERVRYGDDEETAEDLMMRVFPPAASYLKG